MKKKTFGLMLISMLGATLATIFTAKKLVDINGAGIHKWEDGEVNPPEEEKEIKISLDENDEEVEAEEKIAKDAGENMVTTRFICKMRETPGPEGEIMCIIEVGEEMSVLGEVKGWYKVFYAGKMGYVSKRGAVMVGA